MKKKDIEWYAICFFISFGIFGWILQLYQIIYALFNDFQITIHYNLFNEFWLELILIPIILLFMIIGAIEVYKNGDF